MSTSTSPNRRRPRSLTLAAVAAAAVVCLALALAAPRTQAAVAVRTAPAAEAGQAVQAARIAAQHPKPVTLWPSGVNCTKNCYLYTICLKSANTHCASFDAQTVYNTVLGTINTAIIIWQLISNKQGKTTDESEGDEGGNEQTRHLCLAADAPLGSDRVFVTTNCFNNDQASWVCMVVGKTGCHYYNVYALDQGDAFMLTTLNTREGAYMYVKPQTAGDWQTWSWYYFGICASGCVRRHPVIHRADGHARVPVPARAIAGSSSILG